MLVRSSRRALRAIARPLPVGFYLALVLVAAVLATWCRDGAPWTRS